MRWPNLPALLLGQTSYLPDREHCTARRTRNRAQTRIEIEKKIESPSRLI
jgi:hypothetical protein